MEPMRRPFAQVDVFSSTPYYGNPVAVVLDGDGLTTEQMQRFAHWTNLSETTFVLPSESADYRVRIFTPVAELPFAGHPTLGTCHAWLEAGGRPASQDVVVQECEAGLVRVRRGKGRLAFAAPPLIRSGPVEEADVQHAADVLRIPRAAIVDAQWADNGPGWMAVLLESAEAVLALEPDFRRLGAAGDVLNIATAPGLDTDILSRVFAPGAGIDEDPVTGSAHSVLTPYWAERFGRESFSAWQASRRGGHVGCTLAGDRVILGGRSVTVIEGVFTL